MKDEQDKLRQLLNASGFAFQLGLEEAVRSGPVAGTWRVTAREYPWVTRTGRGYIDLILTRGNVHLVVECKRSRDAVWMFLMPDQKQLRRSRARIRWTQSVPNGPNLADWGDIQVSPESPEVEFCAIRGQGETDRPLLERIAATAAEAAESISVDFLELRKGSPHVNVIIPVIVTSAQLTLSQFKPGTVDLGTGEIGTAEFATVPHVRFRKSLGSTSIPDEYDAERLEDLRQAAERTVFVVSGEYFVAWLSEFDTGGSSRPWESARRVADALRG